MISVVVPCYNSSAFVGRAIESVFRQTYKNWEIILVDNNSADNTLEVLKQYQTKFPDKITVLSELKRGAPAARNKGFHAAKFEWIQFLDADDELLPDKFERQLALVSQQPAELVVGNFSRIFSVLGTKVKVEKPPLDNDIWTALLCARLGITSANLWHRSAVASVNGWDEQLSSSQEYDLMFRLLKNGAKVAFDIPRVSAYIYYVKNSITRNKDPKKNIKILDDHLNLRFRIRDYLIENGHWDQEKEELLQGVLYSLLMDKKPSIPEVVNKKYDELGLQISNKKKVKQTMTMYVKSIISSLG